MHRYIYVYNYLKKGPEKYEYKNDLTIEDALHYAGIKKGSSGTIYYLRQFDNVSKEFVYYLTVPNKYRHHLGITEDDLANCLETMDDVDWMFLSKAVDVQLDFLDLWHILYVFKTNSDYPTYFLNSNGWAILRELNLGVYLDTGYCSLTDFWNQALMGMSWADMEQTYQSQFERNYDILMGYLAMVCVNAVGKVNRPPVQGGGSVWDKGKQVYDNFDIDTAYVKPKHLSTTGGGGAKFLGNSKIEAEDILKEAMRWKDIKAIFDNGLTEQGNQSYGIIIDAGKVIGTAGEKLIKIILSVDGGMLTAFPVKGIN